MQFGCLMYEGIMLFIFSRMDTIESAIPMLIMFSVGVQVRGERRGASGEE